MSLMRRSGTASDTGTGTAPANPVRERSRTRPPSRKTGSAASRRFPKATAEAACPGQVLRQEADHHPLGHRGRADHRRPGADAVRVQEAGAVRAVFGEPQRPVRRGQPRRGPQVGQRAYHPRRGKLLARDTSADAVSEFNEVVESAAPDRDKAIALTYLGIISDEKGEYDRAVDYLTRAQTYDAKNPEIYRNLAIVYRHRKEFDKALESAEKSTSLSDGDTDAPASHGQHLLRDGQVRRGHRRLPRGPRKVAGQPAGALQPGVRPDEEGRRVRGHGILQEGRGGGPDRRRGAQGLFPPGRHVASSGRSSRTRRST